MKGIQRCMVWGTIFLTFLAALAAATADDEDRSGKHRRRERRHSEDKRHGDGNLAPVGNTAYADQCGACHFAYQPELLPAESWRRILKAADDHFGETLDLDPQVRGEIAGYLASRAADNSSAELPRKIMRCLGGQAPLRITEIPCIRREHREIPSQVVKRSSVGSLSNCMACHRTADKGVYHDDTVSIPQ